MENKQILKVIEDVSDVLSIMIELKNSGRFREALEKIDDTLLKYFDCEKDFLYSVSEKIPTLARALITLYREGAWV